MKPLDERVLRTIVSEIAFLEGILEGVSMEEFSQDETLRRASAMTAINIGELAKHLSDGFHSEFPGNELRMTARTRDAYAHGYLSLSFDRVYTTAKEDYPRVKQWIETVLPPVDAAVDATTASADESEGSR